MIKFKDFDSDKISITEKLHENIILIIEKLHENILIYDISFKLQLVQNHCILDLIK